MCDYNEELTKKRNLDDLYLLKHKCGTLVIPGVGLFLCNVIDEYNKKTNKLDIKINTYIDYYGGIYQCDEAFSIKEIKEYLEWDLSEFKEMYEEMIMRACEYDYSGKYRCMGI